MNRYITQGIIQDLTRGRQVALFAPHRKTAKEIFEQVARMATTEHPPTQVRRANGNETITYPEGGQLRIYHANDVTPRGLNPDVAIIYDYRHTTTRFHEALWPLHQNGTELIYFD